MTSKVRAVGRVRSVAALLAATDFGYLVVRNLSGDSPLRFPAYALVIGCLALFTGLAYIIWSPRDDRTDSAGVAQRAIVIVGEIICIFFIVVFLRDMLALNSDISRHSVLLKEADIIRVLLADLIGLLASLVALVMCGAWASWTSVRGTRLDSKS